MNAHLRFALGLVTVVMLGAIATHLLKLEGLNASASPVFQPAVSGAFLDQESKERSFSDRRFRRILRLGDEGGVTFNTPAKVVFHDDALFVLDFGGLKVVKLDREGRVLAQYGGTRGQGPGEVLHPTDFAVDSENRVWICDPTNGRIAVFGPEGGFESFAMIDGRPYRIAFSPEGTYYVMHVPLVERMFEAYERGGSPYAKFGSLLRNQVAHGLTLDGWIDTTEDGRLVYSSLFFGGVFTYDRHGSLEYSARLLEPGQLPNIIRNASGRDWVNRSAPYMVRSLGVADDRLVVLGPLGPDSDKGSVLDTYRVDDGVYVESLLLPEAIERAFPGPDGLLATIQGVEVSVWSPAPAGVVVASGPEAP